MESSCHLRAGRQPPALTGANSPHPPPPAAAGQTVSKTAEVSGVSAGWP